MSKSFLCLTLGKNEIRHPKMIELLAFMKKEVGLPCPEYNPGCISCRAWAAFATLDELWMEYKTKENSDCCQHEYIGYADYAMGKLIPAKEGESKICKKCNAVVFEGSSLCGEYLKDQCFNEAAHGPHKHNSTGRCLY